MSVSCICQTLPRSRIDIFSSFFVCLNAMFLVSPLFLFFQIDWMKLVKGTFQLANMTIDKNEPIIVTTPEYFEKLEATLQKHGTRFPKKKIQKTY